MSHKSTPIIKRLWREARWKAAQLWMSLHPGVEVIGITGSVGKTTTKELVAAVLAEQFPIVRSYANIDPIFNLPLRVLLDIRDSEKFVAELGIDGAGQMDKYLTLVSPRIGIITQFSLAHSDEGHFGSLERLVEEKSKLAKALPPYGWALLNGDDPRVAQLAEETRATPLLCGFDPGNDWHITNFSQRVADGKARTKFQLEYGPWVWDFETNLLGRHHARAATFAVAVGHLLGLDQEQIQSGLLKVAPVSGRLEPKQGRPGLVIDDTYNASPEAAKAAIDVLAELDPANGTLVLGEMLELGHYATEAHREVGAYAAQQGVRKLAALGEHATDTISGFLQNSGAEEHSLVAENHAEVAQWLAGQQSTTILVKGSRGSQMEKVVAQIIATKS